MDVNAFLFALHYFIARQGREVLWDFGIDFYSAEGELREAFRAMESQLKDQLIEYQIQSTEHSTFRWSMRKVHLIKSVVQVKVDSQSVSQDSETMFVTQHWQR